MALIQEHSLRNGSRPGFPNHRTAADIFFGLHDQRPADFAVRKGAEYLRKALNLTVAGRADELPTDPRHLHDWMAEGVIKVGESYSDYCIRTSWLSDPDFMSEMLEALENEGWIKRNQDPRKSRFWSLIQGSLARMFGVFSAYEQQIIYDWIAGDYAAGQINPKAPGGRDTGSEFPEHLRHPTSSEAPATGDAGDFGTESRKVEELLNNESQIEAMDSFIKLMSPSLHHTASGLKATSLFKEIYR